MNRLLYGIDYIRHHDGIISHWLGWLEFTTILVVVVFIMIDTLRRRRR